MLCRKADRQWKHGMRFGRPACWTQFLSHRGKRALYSDGARAWMTAGKHLGIKCYQVSHQRKEFCRSLSEVDPKLSKKAGTQVIDRKWKALKDFLPRNYHRKVNGPHGSQVNPLLRKRVFQFCWRNSLQSPSPAKFLKHLAKLQCKKNVLAALVFRM